MKRCWGIMVRGLIIGTAAGCVIGSEIIHFPGYIVNISGSVIAHIGQEITVKRKFSQIVSACISEVK